MGVGCDSIPEVIRDLAVSETKIDLYAWVSVKPLDRNAMEEAEGTAGST